MIINRRNIENLLLIVISTTFLGQIYMNPSATSFRLSMAAVALPILLIQFSEMPTMLVCSIVAIFIPFFRTMVHFLSVEDMMFSQLFFDYFPAAIFYVCYGMLFELLGIRKKLKKSIPLIISLWLCDSGANFLEISVRRYLANFDYTRAVLNIIVVGLIRAIIVYMFIKASMYTIEKYDSQQKEIKYREMVFFISGLKSELFFLRKSIADIEDTMKKSYELYRDLQDTELKERVLTISKNIHEIKKDYYRVTDGMEKVLSEEDKRSSMWLQEIFHIIEENSNKTISARGLNIKLKFRYSNNFKTVEFYPLISALNNLIINSIEAIEGSGEIIVMEEADADNYIFSVIDNGTGIDPDILDALFIPGFSTKYDINTGRMSTGIGLCHVKQIVENYFDGSINGESSKAEKWTCFKLTIPKENLIVR